MPSYHQPLDADQHEIRLVKIHPGSINSPIQCSIVHQSLLHATDYVALSYPCGDVNNLQDIIIENNVFSIYANLKAALRQLRVLGVNLVWADAISINQDDKQEKSHQIRALRYVYMKASRTYAWLGDDGGRQTSGAMTFLQNILTRADMQFPELRRRNDLDRNQPLQSSTTSGSEISDLTSILPSAWLDRQYASSDLVHQFQALMSLLQRDYWQRRWIIQEIAVSPFVYIICRSRLIYYTDLQVSLAICQRSVYWSPEHDLAMQNLEQISHLRRMYRHDDSVQLAALVYQTRLFKSHDVRDSLFALIGISKDGPQLVPLPSYVQDPDIICRNFSKSLLRVYGCFEIISLAASMTSNTLTLPSWSLNWLVPSQLNQDVLDIMQQDRPLPMSAVIDSFREESDMIRVRGIALGTISQVTSVLDLEQEESLASAMPQAPLQQNARNTFPASHYYASPFAVERAVLQCLFSSDCGIYHSEQTTSPRKYSRQSFVASGKLFLRRAQESSITGNGSDLESLNKLAHCYGRWMLQNGAFIVQGRPIFHQLQQPSNFGRLLYGALQTPAFLVPFTVILALGIALLLPGGLIASQPNKNDIGKATVRYLFLISGALWGLFFILIFGGPFLIQAYRCRSGLKKLCQSIRERDVTGARRLVVSERGTVAMTSPHAQIGDQLCIIAGCSHAVVLRPTSTAIGHTRHRIVGRVSSVTLNVADVVKYRILNGMTVWPAGRKTERTKAQQGFETNSSTDPWWQDIELI